MKVVRRVTVKIVNCAYCGQEFNVAKSVSGLINHIRNNHPNGYADIVNYLSCNNVGFVAAMKEAKNMTKMTKMETVEVLRKRLISILDFFGGFADIENPIDPTPQQINPPTVTELLKLALNRLTKEIEHDEQEIKRLQELCDGASRKTQIIQALRHILEMEVDHNWQSLVEPVEPSRPADPSSTCGSIID